jgi:hypothetical protein
VTLQAYMKRHGQYAIQDPPKVSRSGCAIREEALDQQGVPIPGSHQVLEAGLNGEGVLAQPLHQGHICAGPSELVLHRVRVR